MNTVLMFDSIVAVLSLLIGVLLHKWFNDRRIGDAGSVAKRIIEQAERDMADGRAARVREPEGS